MVIFWSKGFPPHQPSFINIPPQLSLGLTGALLCLKESNFFIRWFFARIKQHNGQNGTNPEEAVRAKTGNGRVIGSLERLLIYAFLIAGHNVAIPVVVAVKALARFKSMEEHQSFAEYVIIGTFLSILLTFGIYAGIFMIPR